MPEWLQRELGPFPVWQWLVIVGGGLALAVIVNRVAGPDGGRSGRPVDPTQNPYAGTQATGGPGVTYASNRSATVELADGQSRPTTNREWVAVASSLVATIGLYQPVEIDTALRRYLQGTELNATQLAIVNDALRMVGPPPEGAPPIIRDQPVPSDPGPTGSSVPDGRFILDEPAPDYGIYTIDNTAVRVGGTTLDGARRLSEYGSAGGAPAVIDSRADVRFVETARGMRYEDPGTARLILSGSFGPVAESIKPYLRSYS